MKNNPNNFNIKQVIVVEGKNDTQKLKKIFGDHIQTIETHGLALNKKTIALIQEINDTKGIIILTDPDGAGKKIRQKLNNELNGEIKNAFITKNDIKKGSKKIGVAEANEQAIIDALKHLITFKKTRDSLSWQEYLDNDFYLKNNRKIITNYFHFDEKMSSKALFKWLNLMGLKVKEIKKIIESGKD